MYKLMGPNAVYNMPLALQMEGRLDVEALRRSVAAMVARHEVLRTRFVEQGEQVYQCFFDNDAIELQVEQADSFKSLQKLYDREWQYRFNLQGEPLCRFILVEGKGLQKQDNPPIHALLINWHHIIFDGWSMGVFFREFIHLYKSYCKNQPPQLAPLAIQYADFSAWQRSEQQQKRMRTQLEYWRTQLAGLPTRLNFPSDRQRPAKQTFAGASVQIEFDAYLSDQLSQFSKSNRVTLFMTLISVYALLLGRYSGQQDLAIGTPVANRLSAELEKLLGFFVNTLVIRTRIKPHASFETMLAEMKAVTIQAFSNQDIPFEHLVEAINPQRSLSQTPLFQVMFALQNTMGVAGQYTASPTELAISGLEFEQQTQGVSRFDMSLSMAESQSGLVGMLEYNTDLFDRATMQRFLTHYRQLLRNVISNPKQPIHLVQFLSDVEISKQLKLADNGVKPPMPESLGAQLPWIEDYPDGQSTIHRIVEQVALMQGEKEALRCGKQSFSYAELNRRANQLAHLLLKRNQCSQAMIGVCLEPGCDMIVALLAVLKTGAAYVPISPTNPPNRNRIILNDAGVMALISKKEMAQTLGVKDVICLDEEEILKQLMAQGGDNPDCPVTPDHAAYLIYTSGSSGTPKGVVCLHGALLNMIANVNRLAPHRCGDVASLWCDFCFDVSCYEIFDALTSGASLFIFSHEQRFMPQALFTLLQEQRVNRCYLPPTYLADLAAWMTQGQTLNLTRLLVGVEPIQQELLQHIKQHCRDLTVINGYGPSETTVCATLHKLDVMDEPDGIVPIGRPLDNLEIYLFDEYGQLVPKGCVGEVNIGGAGLAMGYHNNTMMTAVKFVPHPFSQTMGARLYKSGDLARFLPNGELQYVSRIDNQVKVNGFRIELAEVEQHINACKEVDSSLVLSKEDAGGSATLVSYVKLDLTRVRDIQPTQIIRRIKQRLQQELADYMVPSLFVVIDQWPMTPNGKLDIKALPEADIFLLQGEYVAPCNDIEQNLVDMWSELLCVPADKISTTANFFDLGGHSLLATKLTIRINEAFACAIGVAKIFDKVSVAMQAEYIEELQLKGDTDKPPTLKPIEAVDIEKLEEVEEFEL